ncbi:MAG TPA: hypothetical protein VGM90_28040 [Kofleriaceae bacterium]|jgi:hypothetical protein
MSFRSRSAFIVAGLVGGVALLILGAAAPGGDSWRWLEMPRHMTLIAIVLGMSSAVGSENSSRALIPLFATPAIAAAWEGIQFQSGDAVTGILSTLAPWLMGGIYAMLAALAITSKTAISSRRRAGAWLVGVGFVVLALTLANESWLTLENLNHNGTFRSSVAWPDTKKIALVLACVATAVGIAIAWVRAVATIPRATARAARR